MSFEMPPSDELLAFALAEDLGEPVARILASRGDASLLDGDVTSSATTPSGTFRGAIVAREAGVVCGLAAVARLFEILAAATGADIECFPLVAEGAEVAAGMRVMEIEGEVRAVLVGERTALNLVMVLSGIASEARRWQSQAGDALAVMDTRKTLPGMRALSKYAVRVGGAHNHRAGLYDMVLIKDNHITAAGGVAQAVKAAKKAHPQLLVECEAETLEQAIEAVSAGADYVLLDNMDDERLAAAVAAVREAAGGRACLTEASGGITFDRLPALAASGVDRVSASALTFAPPMDFGLDVWPADSDRTVRKT